MLLNVAPKYPVPSKNRFGVFGKKTKNILPTAKKRFPLMFLKTEFKFYIDFYI